MFRRARWLKGCGESCASEPMLWILAFDLVSFMAELHAHKKLQHDKTKINNFMVESRVATCTATATHAVTLLPNHHLATHTTRPIIRKALTTPTDYLTITRGPILVLPSLWWPPYHHHKVPCASPEPSPAPPSPLRLPISRCPTTTKPALPCQYHLRRRRQHSPLDEQSEWMTSGPTVTFQQTRTCPGCLLA